MSTTNNPLQQGQILCQVQDLTLLTTLKGDSQPSYVRNVINSSDNKGVVTPQAPVGISGFTDVTTILDSHVGLVLSTNTQPVFVLGSNGVNNTLTCFSAGPAPALTETHATLTVNTMTAVLGLDPTLIQRACGQTLWLLGSVNGQAVMQPWDRATQSLGTELALQLNGTTMPGSPVRGLLVRRQLHAHAVIACVDGGSLSVIDLTHSVLGASPVAPASPTSIPLGTLLEGTTPVMRAATLIAGSADQCTVVAWMDADNNYQLAALGWQNGVFTLLTTQKVSTATANSGPAISDLTPTQPGPFDLSCADLNDEGVDFVLMGYCATFGGIAGVAALLSWSLTQTTSGTYTLTCNGTHAIANLPPKATQAQPFASNGLALAAGLFGGLKDGGADGTESWFMGLVVTGGGASMGQLLQGEASVMSVALPINPGGTFEALKQSGQPDTPANTLLATVGAGLPNFIAIPSDLTGQSVVLGAPTYSSIDAVSQILAIIQAPPFQNGYSDNQMLMFGQTTINQTGLTVSSNKTWTLSKTMGYHINIGKIGIGHSVTKTYGKNFSKTTDATSTNEITITDTISDSELLLVYEMGYDVWIYPLYRPSNTADQDGQVAVIMPQSAQPTLSYVQTTDSNIGYSPSYQNGRLQTYPTEESDLDGYPGSTIFDQDTFTVSSETGVQVTYTHDKVTSGNQDWSTTLTNNSGSNFNGALETTLFDFLPASFNFDLSENKEFSDTNSTTTSMSLTKDISISIQFGSLTSVGLDGAYNFTVTPYIYEHQTLNCLVVAYLVSTSAGASWNNHPQASEPCLLAPYVLNQDPVLASLSRYIVFGPPNANGTIPVTVSIFNYGQQAVTDLVVQYYVSQQPTANEPPGALTKPPTQTAAGPYMNGQIWLVIDEPPVGSAPTPAATVTVPTLDPMVAKTLAVQNLSLKEGQCVSIALGLVPSLSSLQRLFWGVYPPQYLPNISPLSAGAIDE